MRNRKKQKGPGPFSNIFALLLFIGYLWVVIASTSNLSETALAEGAEATLNSIQRASILCYATEGYYPPTLDYIEKHYGVQIDYTHYAVRYEIFASNVIPTIRVMPRTI